LFYERVRDYAAGDENIHIPTDQQGVHDLEVNALQRVTTVGLHTAIRAAPDLICPFTDPRAPSSGSWVAPFRGGPHASGLLPASPRAHLLLAPRAAPTHGPLTGVGTGYSQYSRWF